MTKLIDLIDCKHVNSRFVKGGHDTNGNRYDVRVCFDCGEIQVSGRTDDTHRFNISITLYDKQTAEAVMIPALMFEAEERERLT